MQVHQCTVSGITNGTRQPDYDVLIESARFFGVSSILFAVILSVSVGTNYIPNKITPCKNMQSAFVCFYTVSGC